MSDPSYPAYVHQMLAQARAEMLEPGHEPDAAALCFDVLALFPDCPPAEDLLHEIVHQPMLIRAMRRMLSRAIEEWDDRSWRQPYRLGRAFTFFTSWDAWTLGDPDGPSLDPDDKDSVFAEDVRELLSAGRWQLLQASLVGQEAAAEMAWRLFQEARQRADDATPAVVWAAQQYAECGYFAEAVDLLEELLAAQPAAAQPTAAQARRLWVEVRWWRDNQQRLPWIPPPTAEPGSRWRRVMAQRDAEFAADPDAFDVPLPYIPPDVDELPDDFELPPLTPEGLKTAVSAATPALPPTEPETGPVDWGYLEQLESGDIDVARFPAWARRLLQEVSQDTEQYRWMTQIFLEQFSNRLDEEE
jgi:hypothetical protein